MPSKPLEDGLVEKLIIVTKIVGSLQDENATLIEAFQKQKMEIGKLEDEIRKSYILFVKVCWE